MAFNTTVLFSILIAYLAASTQSNDHLALRSIGAWGVDLTDRDPATRPGDDFYRSQNGKWLDTATIDPTKFANAYWLDLRILNSERVGALLEQSATDASIKLDSPEGKLGRFYSSFMDVKNLDRKGLTPIEPMLKQIQGAKTWSEIVELMAKLDGPWRQRSINAATPPVGASIFSINIAQDQGDPTRYAAYVGQSGFFLPAIDYYTDPKLADVKEKYTKYIASILKRIGWTDADSLAQSIVDFETEAAKSSWTLQQLQDPAASYNPMSLKELKQLTPNFDWDAYLKGAEATRVGSVVVDAKTAFPKLAKLFQATPLSVLKARAAFSLVHLNGWYLDSEMSDAYTEFWVKVVNGGGNSPRTLRGSNLVTANIGTLLDAYYLKKYFPDNYRRAADDMVANLKAAFDERLKNNPWMSQETKTKARQKLAKMVMRVGGPRNSETFDGVDFDATDLIGNLHKATSFSWRESLRDLRKPFDRNRWIFNSATVNYNYLPSQNALEVPAGLFQAPFFDPLADPAVNYGAVGSLIGHMMALGFGESGRKFDSEGRLNDWWSAEDTAKFGVLRKKLEDQYSAIETVPGFHLKGDLLINESLADQGGILAAFDAYHRSLRGQSAPEIDGFTGDQRFFIGRAQMWRAKFREAFLKNQTATAQNAPPFVRINAAFRNLDEWYSAFGVKLGDKLYLKPEDRAHIW
ncbi:MAG: M13 family metallopeptidase [Armatimonadetes bacterium]|nr:M13 family metallopeptidase [Armatimonadota bacterium]